MATKQKLELHGKSGAPRNSGPVAKYNQILRIREELGNAAKFVGKNFRNAIWKRQLDHRKKKVTCSLVPQIRKQSLGLLIVI